MPDALSKKEEKWCRAALQAGVDSGRIQTVIVLSRLHKKDPEEVQNMFMDAYIGVQQTFRTLGQEISDKAMEAADAEDSN